MQSANMTELVSVKYMTVREDIAKHVDRLTELLEQLRLMDTALSDALEVVILVTSVKVSKLSPISPASKIPAEKELNWDDVSA